MNNEREKKEHRNSKTDWMIQVKISIKLPNHKSRGALNSKMKRQWKGTNKNKHVKKTYREKKKKSNRIQQNKIKVSFVRHKTQRVE